MQRKPQHTKAKWTEMSVQLSNFGQPKEKTLIKIEWVPGRVLGQRNSLPPLVTATLISISNEFFNKDDAKIKT